MTKQPQETPSPPAAVNEASPPPTAGGEGEELPYDYPEDATALPVETQQLWTEVGNGLEKNQTVVWKSAVESLEQAKQLLRTRPEARKFLETYMTQIIGILVEQHPSKIGPFERDCVNDSLVKAVDIVAQDLDIQIRRKGECRLLPALAHVLNRKKAYYKGGNKPGGWNHHVHSVQHGHPEVRLRMIDRFRKVRGFSYLHTYLLEKIGKEPAAFPKVDTLHHILYATADALQQSPRRVVATPQQQHHQQQQQQQQQQEQSNSAAMLKKEVEDDAITVANAVMEWIKKMSDEDLKKRPVEQLGGLVHDLQSIFDRLMESRRSSAYDFYSFWRGLVLRLITSPSLPLKLFGWEQVNDLIEAGVDHRPPPRYFDVTNAGCPFVNGKFDYAGPVTPDGYAKQHADISFVRKIPEGEEQGGHKLTLFRCTMRSHQKWWFLSEADEEQPGTDRDIDYYQHKSKEHEEACPPPKGWTTCRSAGVDPPPLLQAHGCMVPPGQEYNTLEHLLAKWAIQNEIVEQVLGDTTIHREVVSRSTALIKFLAGMCNRYDNIADTSGVAPSSSSMTSATLTNTGGKGLMQKAQPHGMYCLQASHLLFAWKTCTRKADAAVATQVYALLVSILPLCPSDLGVPLLKAVQESLTEKNNKDGHDYLFEVGEFCGALAHGKLVETKGNNINNNNGGTNVLTEEVREEALNLLWSVLTHPDATSLKSYENLKRYVTHELRVEPKGSELRERFLQSCIAALSATAEMPVGGRETPPVDEDQALLMVKLTQFVLEACPRQQSEEFVARDSGALPMLLFKELTAYLERKKKGPRVSYFRKNTNHSSKTPTTTTTKKPDANSSSAMQQQQQKMALHERLCILRHVYGLSVIRAGPQESIVMTLEMVATLWRLCDAPEDREPLMIFIARAAAKSKIRNDVAPPLPVVQAGAVQPPDPNVLLPAFTEDVCREVFLSLYCSPDFNYSHLGENGYRSFHNLFLQVRKSPVSTADDKKVALDAQWRVCLTAGNHAVATHAMRDLLSVYISASLNSVSPQPQPMVTDDIVHESFGERISQCLATVKTELDQKAPGSERSAERCLRILNAAIGQQIDSGGYSMTPSTLTRLSQLPPTASLDDALRCLPHGMRGRASYIRIGVIAKCPQMNNHPGQPTRHAVRDNGVVQPKPPSTFKFSLDVHPLETLVSVKSKVSHHCQCNLTSVKAVQINGRSFGMRSGPQDQQMNLNQMPEDSVVDELGIVQGCEIVFVIADRPQQNPANAPVPTTRGAYNNDLSSVFFNDDSKFADQLFYVLLGILESFPRKDPEQMQDSEAPPPASAHKLVWDLILSMPTNLSVSSRVMAACGQSEDAPSVTSADDAMEVDSTSGDSWSQLLDTRNFNRSVYVLLTVDALLQPAPETLMILPSDLREVLEKRLIENANAFRRVFIDSGGFAAVVRFFSQPGGDDKAHTGEARRGNAVALRILKACLFGDGRETPTTDVENVVPPDEAGSELLRSLSDTEGLLKTLTSMVVNDSGISSSTIMDVLRFLRLLFRSQRAAESFVKLPDSLAKRLLVTLLTRDEDSDTVRTSSAINAAMNVRNSVHDLILQTPLLADEALPWLVDAVDHINFQSENASELFDTLERLVADNNGTARSRQASQKELRHLGKVVCQKLASCPRPTSESEVMDLSTAVLCGSLKLLCALVSTSGGPVLREGVDSLVTAIGISRWSDVNGAPNRSVLALVASFSSKTNNDDTTLIDLMGVLFDGFLTPLESASVSICCDKDSRRLGFEVVAAAAGACESGEGYMALVSRVDGLISSCAPSLRHRWGQFGGGADSHSRTSRGTSKYSGLRNQGCTCYMNSALQQLFMMPELRDNMCIAPIPSNFRSSGGMMTSKGAELVGKKISLQWDTGVAYDAMVESLDESTGMHTIRYCPVQVATVGSGHHQQVQPEEVDRLPAAMPDEFVLSEGRPGKETGVFEVVNEPEPDGAGPVEQNESNAMQDDEVKETADESSSRHLLEEVQRTFIHLDEGSRGRCFDPRALVEACACLKLEFDVWQQNDASEFVTKLLDRLEISLKRWAPKHFDYMDHTFGLKQTQQKICKECGLKTNREEKLLSIDCQIRGKSDIHEALAAMTEADVMEGSNKVSCDRCKKKTDTILRTAISTLPNMLILSLKRFDLDFTTFETVKLNSRCAFGQTLNMKHYTLEALEAVEKAGKASTDPAPMDTGEGEHTASADDPLSVLPDEDYEYKLAGVLVHAGVAQGGHYYSFIRDRHLGGEEKWYRFDDEDVTPFNPDLIENECFGGKVKKETKWPNGQVHTVEQEQFANALMLFYEKVKPSDCPDESGQKDSKSAPPKTLATSTGYDVFKPDVRRSNATHRWQSFLFDSEFQTFMRGMAETCQATASGQKTGHCAPLVQTLLNYVFDVMLYSSDRSSLNDWTQRLEYILHRDVESAKAFTHKLARKTDTVSGNWLRTYLLDCPDRASRASSVKIFSAAIRNCASIPKEFRALELWTQGWKEMVEQMSIHHRERPQEVTPYPSKLTGAWQGRENTQALDGGESSCLGIIISFTNALIDYMPRCWRFSTELCMFIRSLASMQFDGRQLVFCRPMIEALVPGRLIALATREKAPRPLQCAFPGASVTQDVANTQIRTESNTTNVMAIGSNQVMGTSDMNNSRGQSCTDALILFEALACLARLPGVIHTPVARDIEEPSRGRNRVALTEAAVEALRTIFLERCTPGAPGMVQREIEYYLRLSGVDASQASPQRIADMMAKYPTTTSGAGEQGIAYLSVDGFLAYYRDVAHSNDLKVSLDLHEFGFRPDLSRRSRNSRVMVTNEREGDRDRRPQESVAIDVAENLDQAVDLGHLTNECFGYSGHVLMYAAECSQPLADYLTAAAVYKRGDPDYLIYQLLRCIWVTPNDWNANSTLNAASRALMVIASVPDDDQATRITLIMQCSSKTPSRNGGECGVGLLHVLRSYYRARQAQHYSNDLQWGMEKYIEILRTIHNIYPVYRWMNENRDKWNFCERDILDHPRSSGMHHHHPQPRMDYGTRENDHHIRLDHHSHTDSDMGGINDSEDDDEDSHFDNTDFGQISNDGPHQIIVDGAGTPEVNGVYYQDGYFENTCKYFREGRWKNSDFRYYIFQCNVSNNTKHWYISIVPYGGHPGTSSDIDFYSAPVTNECQHIPPRRGWVKAPEGQEPPPNLTPRSKQQHDGIGGVVGNEQPQEAWMLESQADEPDENTTVGAPHGPSPSTGSGSGGGGGGGSSNNVVQDRRSRYI